MTTLLQVVPLAKSCWKLSWLGWAVVTILVWAAVGARLIPSSSWAEVHPRVLGQLLLGAAAASSEVGLLLGVPGGVAIAMILSGRAAVARSREGAPQPTSAPRPFGKQGVVLVLGWLLIACIVGLYANLQLSKSTQVLRSVIEQARSSCLSSPARRSVVPLLGATWICKPSEPIHLSADELVSRWHGSLSLSSLEVGEDLRSFSGTGLLAELAARSPFPLVRMKAQDVRVRGLPGWTMPERVSAARRAVLVATCCALLVLQAFWLGLRHGPRFQGLALLAALSVVLVLRWLDAQATLSSWVYLALPLVGLWPFLGVGFSRVFRGERRLG